MNDCAGSTERHDSSNSTRSVYRCRWQLLAVVALGVSGSGAVWGLLHDRERQLLQNDFAALAGERVAAIRREFLDDMEILNAVALFYSESKPVDRSQFATFVNQLIAHEGSIMAIEWAPRVTQPERAQFERRLREQSGVAGGILQRGTGDALTPARERDVYFPVELSIGPQHVEAGALGFDRSSEKAQSRAMQRALLSNTPVMTEQTFLFPPRADALPRRGILVFRPVYDGDQVADMPLASQESVLGFLVAAFQLSDVVASALAGLTPAHVNCRILDEGVTGRGHILDLSLDPTAGVVDELDSLELAKREGLVHRESLDAPGRNWVIECWPSRQFTLSRSSWVPLFSLAVGLGGTAVVAMLIWFVGSRAEVEERLVIERTAELRAANAHLEKEITERRVAEAMLAEHARNLEESNGQLEKARIELQRQAAVDPLTGVLNRHKFAERFAVEWSRTERFQLPLSCVLLDLDFFKKINDTYGHPVGDEVLRTIAQLLQEHTRCYDIVARYGGEEFCAILPSTTEEAAIAWSERLRECIASTPMGQENERFSVTASLGVAARTADVDSPEGLLNQADEALLIAKRQGRNRIVVFSDLHRLETSSLHSSDDAFRGASAADIMTPVLVNLKPSQPLQEAANMLLSLRLDSLPIIDADGRTLGIIGEEDLTAQIVSDKGWQQTVGQVMNKAPVTYEASTPAIEICTFLSRVTVRRVIILRDGQPVGIISRSTLIRWLRNSLLSEQSYVSCAENASAAQAQSSEQLRWTVDRLSSQILALQTEVESSRGNVTPAVVSAATRIQELVDDALVLSAENRDEVEAEYATMGAVLS